ncbi:MAG: hypothetical protein IJH80_05490 [Ruminococcus sp.]|nr:hypothetical protein [Ruminococcus sp.]
MGFFGLFSKKEKQEIAPEQERLYKETPFGRFIYVEYGDEHGYEGDIPWEQNTGKEFPEVSVFFQTDSVDTTEANVTYGRLEKLLGDPQRTDFEIKHDLAQHFLFREGMVKEGSTLEEIIDELEIEGIHLYSNETHIMVLGDIFVNELYMAILPDGTKEARYISYDDGNPVTEKIGG